MNITPLKGHPNWFQTDAGSTVIRATLKTQDGLEKPKVILIASSPPTEWMIYAESEDQIEVLHNIHQLDGLTVSSAYGEFSLLKVSLCGVDSDHLHGSIHGHPLPSIQDKDIDS